MGELTNAELELRLDAIRPEPVTPDEQATKEKYDFGAYEATARLDIEIRGAELTHAERAENMKARKQYARCIFVLLCVWVTSIMATVVASGHKDCAIKLSDPVLIALITGVSINIIGLFAIVANYLFPKS